MAVKASRGRGRRKKRANSYEDSGARASSEQGTDRRPGREAFPVWRAAEYRPFTTDETHETEAIEGRNHEMRSIWLGITGGLLLGSAITAVVGTAWWGPEASRALGEPRQAPARDPADSLLERIRDLERELERERSLRTRLAGEVSRRDEGPEEKALGTTAEVAETPGELPDLETLFELVDRGDAPGLRKAVLALLRQPTEGHPILLDFFYGEVHSPRQTLLHSRPLLGALLSLSTSNGGEVARFGEFLLAQDEEMLDEKLSGHVYRALTLFLSIQRRGYRPLRDRFVGVLLDEIVRHESGARARVAVAALTDLRSPIPLPDLQEHLGASQDRSHFEALLTHLERLVPGPGTGVLRDLLLGGIEPAWREELALRRLARLDPAAAEAVAAVRGIDSERAAALDFARRAATLESAREFLMSGEADLQRKQRFLKWLARQDGKLLEELEIHAEEDFEPAVSELVAKARRSERATIQFDSEFQGGYRPGNIQHHWGVGKPNRLQVGGNLTPWHEQVEGNINVIDLSARLPGVIELLPEVEQELLEAARKLEQENRLKVIR